ncbi:hypothetical protein ABOM_012087 [Aspergillus bombycis]|uniref:Yippee domain-containing protein n=1 Tax=Aspergillus bombycis TaxID=109264 RepID=A0A1F7ZK46_9EURO|nr:hypothetical protein ABOM_012087 [Aspergillus bombycis]OGM39405.1 hypothetical protein ABOM_012087 [Aspergillus bombycis]
MAARRLPQPWLSFRIATVIPTISYSDFPTKLSKLLHLRAATVSTRQHRELMVSITTLRLGLEPSGIPEVPSGSKTLSPSPPPDPSTHTGMESGFLGNIIPEYKGEAAHTIPEECERLFCDTLSVIFLGEGIISGQESLGTDAYQIQPSLGYEHSRIQEWVEVLDYTSDCIYRGFVTSSSDEHALFIFFSECALGQGLKTGLIALFELASLPEFGCSQIVACIPRSQDAAELEVIISKGFTGRHGRAYLVSAEPIACAVSTSTTSSPTESLPNTIMQKPVSRQLVTGAHTVSDISCAFCGNILGWKYVAAEEESQHYKVGKFILETKRTVTSSSWESASYVGPVASSGPMTSAKVDVGTPGDCVEFDSQDEDECEDLFAGVWSPGLAIRRRSRKLDRHTSIFGLTS